MSERQFIWVNGWPKYQSMQTKRGEPWAPPWIKIYVQLLDDDDFNELPWLTQLVLLKVFLAFAQTRLRLAWDPVQLSRRFGHRVTSAQLKSLNDAGYIDFCSRTVLEQRRALFWNCSNLEVEVEKKREPKAVTPTRNAARARANGTARTALENLADQPNLRDMP